MKLAIIGGGSSYTPELMQGLIERAEKLDLEEVRLQDIDKSRLETVAGFCRRMAEAQRAGFGLRTTMNPEEAVESADFIITQVRVGGNQARREDELLGKRHGLIGQETTGVGGFAKALRTVPVMVELARIAERAAPRAWLINFTNPSGLITEALLNHTGIKAVGLCNIPITFHLELAAALKADPEDLELDYVGLNHLSWVRRVKLRGKDITSQVLDRAGTDSRPQSLHELDYPREFIKALGMIPMHYLRYFYLTGQMLEAQARAEKTRAEEVMEIEARLMEIYRDPKAREKPGLLGKRGGANYSRAALMLIESIRFDRKDRQVLDVKNEGTIPGLPSYAVIEVPCEVGAKGPKPLPLSPPEPEIMGLIGQVKAYEQLTIQAAMERSYDKALLALVCHPLGPEADRAKEVLDDIISTHNINLE